MGHVLCVSYSSVSTLYYSSLPLSTNYIYLLINHLDKLRCRPEGRHLSSASSVFWFYPAMPFRCFRHRLTIQPSLNHTTVCVKAAGAKQANKNPGNDFFHEKNPPYILFVSQYKLVLGKITDGKC